MNIHEQGLLPLPQDNRDIKRNNLFGVGLVPNVSFTVGNILNIKNQLTTDFCGAFSSTTISELQEDVELSPEWQMSKIKYIMGDWFGYGADLRSVAKSFVKYGSLEQSQAPFTILNKDRNFLANWNNWPKELDDQALIHKKNSYMFIDDSGYNDLFDALVSTLWQKQKDKSGIGSGLVWRHSWTNAPGGIIPKQYEVGGTPHAIAFIGQKIIDGEPYLICVNSWGESYGDKGLFYFPREVINKECIFGNYCFEDLPLQIAQHYLNNNIKVYDSWVIQLWKVFLAFFESKR